MAGAGLNRQQCRIWLILGCWLMMLIVIFYSWSGGVAVSGKNQGGFEPDNSAVRPLPQPILPRGYGIPNTMRDIFAVPAEFCSVPADIPIEMHGKGSVDDKWPAGQVAEATAVPLALVGIISGGEQKIAIIKYAGSSRTYRIHDTIGPYQLIALESRSAVLSGPNGRKTLLLER